MKTLDDDIMEIKRQATLAERERCAKIAEEIAAETSDGDGEFYIARRIIEAIRNPSV
jgi:hypothetical protein